MAAVTLSTAQAAERTARLTLETRNDATRAVRWEGVAEAAPAGRDEGISSDLSETAGSAIRELVVRIGGARRARVALWIHATQPDDLAVRIYQQDGAPLTIADSPGLEDESVVFPIANNRLFRVRVLSKTGASTAAGYSAAAWLTQVSGTDTGVARTLKYEKPNVCGDTPKRDANNKVIPLAPCYVGVKVPIDIVFVGFNQREIEVYTGDIMSALPNTEDQAVRVKPVVLDESIVGGAGYLAREGGATTRSAALLQGSRLGFLPFAYDYRFRIRVADEKYSRAMFAAAKAATTPGDYSNPRDRAYLESYNARAAALRRSRPVAPASSVDFIDATKLEDWIAKNPPRGLGFDLRKPSSGYTYFVLDTYRPAYAGQYFNLNRYHHFRVMNSLTKDPDTSQERGFDWGRVWGGRYRFLMLDTGAAPNSFEGSTQQTSVPYRTAFDGDSALLDPPVWEYTGCVDPLDCADLLPTFYQRISENVLSATFLRFTPSYASRPRASDRYFVAASTWRDANAVAGAVAGAALPGAYDSNRVVARLQELIPAAGVSGDERIKDLIAGDAEQIALDDGRARGAGAVGVSAVMRHLNQTQAGDSATVRSLRVLNVFHPGHFEWSGADEAGTAVPTLGRAPWGVINGISDLSGSAGLSGGFTAQTLRNIGRAMGLLPSTEGVFYTDDLPPELSNLSPHPAKPQEQERAYYKAFDFTHATTATPMSTGFFYGRFEVLDRDAMTRALTMDWIDRSLDDVEDAYAAMDALRYREAPASITKQILRAGRYMGNAIALMTGGYAKEAVASARVAKREMEQVVRLAVGLRRR